MKMIKIFYLILLLMSSVPQASASEITPYKFTEQESKRGYSTYTIPESSRFTTARSSKNTSKIVYYFSKPKKEKFPIAILIGGSSLEYNIASIIHFHRYFLKEFLDLGVAVLTVEQQGVDGNRIDVYEFMQHYTRSNRLQDHRAVITHLKKNPPLGWNGKFIFLGVSEGGPIATTLTTDYLCNTIATVIWSGASGFSWKQELWDFMQDIPWYAKLYGKLPVWIPHASDLYFPGSRKEYNKILETILNHPRSNLKLAGMTYMYHADALKNYPKVEYKKIKTPFLVVNGQRDSTIQSADAFVKKAQKVGAPITYMRIVNMDHFIRHRPDIISDSFVWLKQYL